ncbi:YolD-like family protein [Priestia aryabhattai]|uniref:YolD-like family protein n=1 Tax=Priestia aryabhattai TaxID=412384 RepID=UPI001596FD7D|nr:YolD-like family protein [Priestia aryabhattai]
MFKDQARTVKPILGEHQKEEFDLCIAYGAEYYHAVKLTVWYEGFIHDITVVFITSIQSLMRYGLT